MKIFAFYVVFIAFLMAFMLGNVNGLQKCDDEKKKSSEEDVPCPVGEFK